MLALGSHLISVLCSKKAEPKFKLNMRKLAAIAISYFSLFIDWAFCMANRRDKLLLTLASTCMIGSANAVDAGAELRRFQDETQRRMQEARPTSSLPATDTSSPARAAAESSTHTVHVARYEVVGVTIFSEAEVENLLRDFTGRAVSTTDIHAAADALMRQYRKRGYFLAKVFVPPQTFHDVVKLEVEEGRLEANGVEIVNKGSRVNTDVVQEMLSKNLYSDKPLKRNDLERALLLTDDLPGTRIGSIIYPGQEVGTARLRAVMSDEPLVSGNVDIDNFNSRPLGQERLGATVRAGPGNSDSWISDSLAQPQAASRPQEGARA